MKLKTTDHSRDSVGLTYVYPVLSRRAGGLSIGINLNPNNACNWQCVYCQVPELIRGNAPEIDLEILSKELQGFLEDVLDGDFFDRIEVEPAYRVICDIAISGNGEPTSAREFAQVVSIIERQLVQVDLLGKVKLTLITNGSLVHHDYVQTGLLRLAAVGGEVWYKLDSATDAGLKRINHAAISAKRARENLYIASRCCPLWLQTCLFAWDEVEPLQAECDAYLVMLRDLLAQDVSLQGVMLYGLARPSMQAEASHLSALPAEWLTTFAEAIESLGINVKVSV